MKLSFEFNNYKITYNVMYKKRSSIAINVEPSGVVNVLAPVGTPVRTVMDKVKGHGAWILYELSKLEDAMEQENKTTDSISELTQCMYLGKTYGLEMVENTEVTQASVKLVRGKFVVEANVFHRQTVRDALCFWYMSKLNTKAKERLKIVAEHFNKVPKKIKVDILAKTLWEIEKDCITLDVNTIIGPVCILDFVLVEALCKFNQIEDTQAMIMQSVEHYEEAQLWLQNNKDKFLFY